MAFKRKPIIVTLTKTKHKKQPWTFVIDMPGPQKKQTKAERYSTPQNARRGARNQIGGKVEFLPVTKVWWSYRYDQVVKFVYAKKVVKVKVDARRALAALEKARKELKALDRVAPKKTSKK